MGLRQFEAEILAEARKVTGNSKLRQKDIMEWSTGEVKAHEGETVYRLPGAGVNIAVKVQPKTAKPPSLPRAPEDSPPIDRDKSPVSAEETKGD